MRLIDADKLMEKLNECFYDTTNPVARRAEHDTMALCKSLVEEQTTAYDVDKVVGRINEMSGIQFDGENESYQLDWCIETGTAIKIVKSGGIE